MTARFTLRSWGANGGGAPQAAVRLVLVEGVRLGAGFKAAGVPGALGLTGLLRSLLFNVLPPRHAG